MRQIVPALLACFAVACGGSSEPAPVRQPTEPPVVRPVKPAQWALEWADEFNGATVDTTNWIIVEGAATINNELQFYTPSDVYLENGDLVLRSQRRTFGNRQYSSGEVRTGTKRIVRAGQAVEWRTQIPKGKGIWPANWLVNTPCTGVVGCGFNWPPEIDVMEIRGSAPDINLMTHWWGTFPNQGHQTSEYGGSTLSVGYHTYRVECFRDSILWYVDGTQRAKHTSQIAIGDLQLIMNTAVGGNFDGNPEPATVFPAYQRIDYVRVYRDTANVR
jgi:beta-glucanase (GH16 family)